MAEVKEQAATLQGHAAGFVAHRTIELGLRTGIIDALAGAPDGLEPGEIAATCDLDAFYVGVWCRAAFAAQVLDSDGGQTYRLAEHMGPLLLDEASPAYVGGLFTVLVQPEVFDRFGENFASGARIWWDETTPEWIDAVSKTGGAFNNRLIPTGISRVPGAKEKLDAGGRVLELACGTGYGLSRLREHFPAARLTGHDGDAYSLERARKNLEAAAIDDVSFLESALEDIDAVDAFDVITINVSMHECRDIEQVTKNVKRALAPGGIFIISDFAFPDSPEGLRTLPGRVQTGVQFFEALIGDQLLPTAYYVELLKRHGFESVGSIDVNPIHGITHGTA